MSISIISNEAHIKGSRIGISYANALDRGSLPFHTPQAPSFVHRALRIDRTPVASRGSSHVCVSEGDGDPGRPPLRRDRPLLSYEGLSCPPPENNGGSSSSSSELYNQSATSNAPGFCVVILQTHPRYPGHISSSPAEKLVLSLAARYTAPA